MFCICPLFNPRAFGFYWVLPSLKVSMSAEDVDIISRNGFEQTRVTKALGTKLILLWKQTIETLFQTWKALQRSIKVFVPVPLDKG